MATCALTCLLGLPGAREAQACSPVAPAVLAISPQDGSTVPTNAHLMFRLLGSTKFRVEYEVEGATVAVDLGTLPSEPLSEFADVALPPGTPGTRATVRLIPLDDGVFERTTSFTYGADADATAPAVPDPPVIKRRYLSSPPNNCGVLRQVDEVYVQVQSALGETIAGHELTYTTADWSAQVTTVNVEANSTVLLGYFDPADEVCVTVRAVDRAGNWSAPTASSCSVPSSGCTAAGGSLPGLATTGLLLGGLALLRRRKAG